MNVDQACLAAFIQQLFHCYAIKTMNIVFIHTHGRNGSYNPHLHIFLAEGISNQEKINDL